jgi:hypothetical protein
MFYRISVFDRFDKETHSYTREADNRNEAMESAENNLQFGEIVESVEEINCPFPD